MPYGRGATRIEFFFLNQRDPLGPFAFLLSFVMIPAMINQHNSDYFNALRSEIFPLVPKNCEKLLDIGCGAGRTSSRLKELGLVRYAVGMEVDPVAAAEAKNHLDHVIVADLNRDSFPVLQEKFDLVLCLDVLEHLLDPWSALKEIHKNIQPGGSIIVSLPNVRNFRVLLPLLFAGRWDYRDTGILERTHFRFFTKKSAQELVTNAGFTIEKIEYTGGINWGPALFVRLLSFNLLKPFTDIQYLILARKN